MAEPKLIETLIAQTHTLPRQILVEYFSIQTQIRQAIEIPCEQERLGFFICLSGQDRLTLNDTKDVVYIRRGVCGIYHEPEGLFNTAEYHPAEPFAMLSITMPIKTLETVFSKGRQALKKLLREKGKFPARPYAFLCFETQPLIQTAASQILTPPVDRDLFPAYLEGKVLEIAALMLQTLCTGSFGHGACPSLDKAETAKLLQARAVMSENLELPPSPLEIAGQCGLGIDRMNRGFKRMFGQTPAQYLRDCRMEKAKALLASGDCNVTDACFRVGYSNLSHFAKVYRNYFGHSPVKDRKQFF